MNKYIVMDMDGNIFDEFEKLVDARAEARWQKTRMKEDHKDNYIDIYRKEKNNLELVARYDLSELYHY